MSDAPKLTMLVHDSADGKVRVEGLMGEHTVIGIAADGSLVLKAGHPTPHPVTPVDKLAAALDALILQDRNWIEGEDVQAALDKLGLELRAKN